MYFKQLLSTPYNKIYLLYDIPGMGKSTELKMLAMRLKECSPFKWILFVDLKDHIQCYPKNGIAVNRLIFRYYS